MLSAFLADLGAELDFFEDAYYRGFAESGFLHVETPSGKFSTFEWFRFSRGLQNTQAAFGSMRTLYAHQRQ